MTRKDERAAYERKKAQYPLIPPPRTVAGQRRLVWERVKQMRGEV